MRKIVMLAFTLLWGCVPVLAQPRDFDYTERGRNVTKPFSPTGPIQRRGFVPFQHKEEHHKTTPPRLSSFQSSQEVGMPFMIDTNIVYGPAGNTQYDPRVAFDGTNYMIVWHEYDYKIYGARVNETGKVLDTLSIIIATERYGRQRLYPSIAFDGTNYLVVWEEGGIDIYGARVSKDGTVLDLDPIAICTTEGYQQFPHVTFGGTNYLVVWDDYRNDPGTPDVYGTRVSKDGVVLDTSGIAISTAANYQYYASVAFDGTNYLVVWTDYRNDPGDWSDCDVYGARVSQQGTVLDPQGIAISKGERLQAIASIAFDGTNYLVVWEDDRHGRSDWDIYGQRVSPSGTLLGSEIEIMVSGLNPKRQQWPSVTFDGTNYLVVWNDSRNDPHNWWMDIYGARVSKDGIVLDSGGFAISIAPHWQESHSVASSDTNFLVVWQDWRGAYVKGGLFQGCVSIYGTRISKEGTVLDTNGFIISMGANQQTWPSVAFDGTNYLAVWQDYRKDTYFDIYGSRVSQTGTVLDISTIAISTAEGSQVYPSVVSNGENYLVVWEDYRNDFKESDIYGARVASDGTVLDPDGIPICTAPGEQWYPQVASDGTDYFVVWQDKLWDNDDIYGARVSKDGIVLDTAAIAISTAKGCWSPSVAFDGTNYFVVWRGCPGDSCGIYGARISPEGVVLDPEGITISTEGEPASPSVAFDGTYYFVVWAADWGHIYGARVSKDGTVLDTLAFKIADGEGPSVGFDGANYLVTWNYYWSWDYAYYIRCSRPQNRITLSIINS